MDEFSKALMVHLWSDTVNEIGEDAFDKALRQVLQTSSYRPDISEIRKAAGVNHGIVDPVEREAKASLLEVIKALRSHGPQLKTVSGKLIRDSDSDGRALPRSEWVWDDEIPAPIFDAATEATLLSVGFGSRNAGTEVISRHPSLPWNRPQDEPNATNGQFRQKLGREIETLWVQSYREAKATKREG